MTGLNGDREAVERLVDAALASLEARERAAREGAGLLQVAHFAPRTSWMCTSTAATGSPVRRSTS